MAPSQPATAVIVTEDEGAYLRIAGVLSCQPDREVCVERATWDDWEHSQCDLVVFHFDSIGSADLERLAKLRRSSPELLVIVVCESANGRSARRALDGGVDGLIFGSELDTGFTPTISAVMAGMTVVPRALRAAVRKPSLSYREKQILGMVVMGFTNSEIGARLFLAESTVKSHLSSAFNKLGVRSRNEAASMILDPHGSLGTGILAIAGVESDAQDS